MLLVWRREREKKVKTTTEKVPAGNYVHLKTSDLNIQKYHRITCQIAMFICTKRWWCQNVKIVPNRIWNCFTTCPFARLPYQTHDYFSQGTDHQKTDEGECEEKKYSCKGEFLKKICKEEVKKKNSCRMNYIVGLTNCTHLNGTLAQPSPGPSPRRFSKWTIRHSENSRGEGPGDEVDLSSHFSSTAVLISWSWWNPH